MTSEQIRQQFLDFFVQRHGHRFVPSSPVVPLDDPTLLFTNAGMNQFKPIFLGLEKRDYNRAANTQKCIRAGGKHNDLDDVGRSRRHHTFFEMLGNWSFGDYFKRGAIQMAWELLTKVWRLDPKRLHVSCYEGNEAAGIPRDTEAANIWKDVAGVPEDHIHYFGKDNFWEMGDTGPCGPCTEIYYDRRPEAEMAAGGRAPVNGDDPRVMEIWNNVFIQYNRSWKDGGDAAVKAFDVARGEPVPGEDVQATKDRIRQHSFGTIKREEWVGKHTNLEVLPAQHVDTGMGLERICQVLQGKDDNFATDLWTPLFDAITTLSGITYGGKFPRTNAADPVAEAADPQLRHDIAFRVVADHVRCLTFALTDGAVPSNEGRGYVLRRILRRAVRFGRQQLGLKEPFLHTLVPVIVDSMSGAFPELKLNPTRVVELVKEEELSFGRTLDRGIQLFEEAAQGNAISAGDAFKLHDTYGFPIDLTRIMAEERGMTVDIAGYEKLMEQAKELARSGGREKQSKVGELSPAALAELAKAGVKPTDDQAKFAHDPIQATVQAIWDGDDLGLSPAHAAEDEELALVLDRTNFYAEMGGQVGDAGELRTSGGGVFDVESTKVAGGYVLHVGRVRSGKLQAGDVVTAEVRGGRERTEKNHTTTHLANWALREVLGDDVQQKGSLVDPEKLRFDFSHGKAMTDEEVARVETLVNEGIARRMQVYAEVAPQEQAMKIHGLRAVFGEKYPPMVRVVSVGVPVAELLADPQNPRWRQHSVEFCGGTHLRNSADARAFAVTGEEAVSKGIRRIVALTGDAAEAARAAAAKIDELVARAKSAPDAELQPMLAGLQAASATTTGAAPVPLRARRRAQAAITELQARIKAFEKANKSQAGAAGSDAAVSAAATLLAAAPSLGGGKLIVGDLAGVDDDALRAAVDSLRKKTPSHAILLGSAAAAGKVTFMAVVSDDLIAKGLKAGDWVREAAKVAGGSGGGRPQLAQAGAKDPAKLPDALARATAFAQATVK